jgi:hypothetical protein
MPLVGVHAWETNGRAGTISIKDAIAILLVHILIVEKVVIEGYSGKALSALDKHHNPMTTTATTE